MKRKLFIVLVLSIIAYPSFCKTVIYHLKHSNGTTSIPFTYYQNILLNDICLKKISTCQAYRAFKNPAKVRMKLKNHSHHAALYCKSRGGIFLVLNDHLGREISSCAFQDKTMIRAWDLYEEIKKHGKGSDGK